MQELQPQLAELLRTCVHPPSLRLQVTHIDFLEVKNPQDESTAISGAPHEDAHRYAVRYILSDGEIMMQALLHRKLGVLREVADVSVGDLLDIRSFAVKKSKRSNGQGHVIYLAIDDCHFLQQPRPTRTSSNKESLLKQPDQTRRTKRSLSRVEEVAPMDVKKQRMESESSSGGLCKPAQSEADPAGKSKEISVTTDKSRLLLTSTPERANGATSSKNETSVYATNPSETGHANLEDSHKAQPGSMDRRGKRDSKSILSNTFGARRVILDEEDSDDDYFEPLSTTRLTGGDHRTVLQNLDNNVAMGFQSSPAEQHDGVSDSFLLEISKEEPLLQEEILRKERSAAELPQVASASVPKRMTRDGTFALSQIPTSFQPVPAQFDAKASINQRQVNTQPALQPPTQSTILPCPPFHTLASLRNPPPSQPLPAKSYTLTTLAIISWTGTSTIHRSGSLFPPKRHLKIIDPSLSTSRPPSRQIPATRPGPDSSNTTFRGHNSFQDAVTVAVYIDATNFKPPAGTVVLFRGLVMQRLGNGDIILNAYGRLKEQRFENGTEDLNEHAEKSNLHANIGDETRNNVANLDSHWFITDHSRIRNLGHGSRLDYYLDWWAEKQRSDQSGNMSRPE